MNSTRVGRASEVADRPLLPGGRLVALFVVATFVFSWSCWFASQASGGALGSGLAVLGRFGPSLCALGIVKMHRDQSVWSFLGDRLRWRGLGRFWIGVLLGPPLAVLGSLALAASAGEHLGDFNDPSTLYLIVPAFVVVFVAGGPLGEEVGWRGLALEPLQEQFGPLRASLGLGLVWGLWHLPLFADPEQIQHGLSLPIYLGQTTATAVVYTWLWNRSRSLPLVMTFHASTNVAAGAFPLLVPDAESQLPFAIAVIGATIVAVGLVLFTGGRLGWDSGSSRAIAGVQAGPDSAPPGHR